MFSRIFLSLAVLSAAGAIPARGGRGSVRAVDNESLKTPGLYQIRQHVQDYTYKYLQTNDDDQAPLQMLVPSGHEQYLPMWWVRELGDDKFDLQPYGGGIHAAVAPGSNSVIGSEKSGPLSTWAIESSGNNLWTIKVPGRNLVWKSNSNSSISLESAEGTADEKWDFNYYGGP
ncbi:hypothetical protein DFH07DRAFT_948183 [Mycena maculata]|uniref:Ricin B lectin domain-containing protein n=1 Tax=Mycena maculata TaxID=230809 RepID=A0AAD7KHX7_9AGAR|nr:hypothetical protein DFH07DRAFT_948183 [Mycena maculata]